MKLTEVSVDGYGCCNNLRLQNFDRGLTLVFGRPATGKSTLIRYIRNVLYGFGTQPDLGHGALEVEADGSNFRLIRTVGTNGEFVASDLRGTRRSTSLTKVKATLDAIGDQVFDAAFVYSEQNRIDRLAQIAADRCGVPVGPQAATGNLSLVHENDAQIRACQDRLAAIESQISVCEQRRQELNERIDELEFNHAGHRSDIETELQSISHQLHQMSATGLKSQIQSLDHEIILLQNQLEAEATREVSTLQLDSTGLPELYQRLDEIDDQIRRWRQIHSDIQQQRVELKNEMVVWNELEIDSSKHPYHRAQEIVTAIESKVGLAEQSVGALQEVQIVTPENNAMAAERLSEICTGIRKDLYELCDELSSQFKQIRHRAAAAELKRLRRCYEEVGENIQVMVQKRESVLAQIRLADPEGARLVERQANDFCRCAMHDGYLQARRRFGGPLEIVQTRPSFNFENQRRQLDDLRSLRGLRVNELVDLENGISRLEARRQELLQQQRQLPDLNHVDELREQYRRIQAELTNLESQRQLQVSELERLRAFRRVAPNILLQNASSFADRMTDGAVQSIWLDESTSSRRLTLAGADSFGKPLSFETLPDGQRVLVGFAMSLAIAQHFSNCGENLPLLVDNAFAGMSDQSIDAILAVMVDFCDRGNQLIAFTTSRTAIEFAGRMGVTTMDLPETSVSPARPFAPVWTPDRVDEDLPREPEFLTPYTTRMHKNVQSDMNMYPRVKYPPMGLRLDHSPASFEGPQKEKHYDWSDSEDANRRSAVHTAAARPVSSITENAALTEVGIFDSMDLERLNQLGVFNVEQLMAIDPDAMPAEFTDAQILPAQIDQWQAMSWLIVCVPGLSPTDAKILYVLGITEPEQLENTNSMQLIERISRFLRSPEGQAFSNSNRHYDRDTVSRWYESLERTRSHWRLPSGYSRRNRYRSQSYSASRERDHGQRISNRNPIRVERDRESSRNSTRRRRDWRPEREPRVYDKSLTREPRSNSAVSTSSTKSFAKGNGKSTVDTTKGSLKFYLELADDLEAAPSIGPKTAERFIKVGVKTIDDFLKQTAESMATKINYKRITAEVIRQWQHQARLVCRVPNLRGHDAQLLVACGITEPEDLADRQPQALFGIVEPFAKSKDGLKIIRGGKQPDLEEIENWIRWARETRSLQAA